jgi:peroxisomal membrane protein 4
LIVGIVYGIKIRFPHALIMTFLFRSGPYVPPAQTVSSAKEGPPGCSAVARVPLCGYRGFGQMLTSRLSKKFEGIFKLTFQHARNLGLFVVIYKTLMYAQKMSRGGREEKIDPFVAGLVGGGYIFGNDSAVVQQVPTYLPFPKSICRFLSLLFFSYPLNAFGILGDWADGR